MPEGFGHVAITLGERDDFRFVMASHKDAPNVRYAVYQHHSANFPDSIHCEAKKDDVDAIWLCGEDLTGEK